MIHISSILLLTLLPLSAMVVSAGAPSGSPNCYVCPSKDKGDFGLGQHSNSGGTLFCSYPSTPGGNANTFYCNYDSNTGDLTKDHDGQLCPGEATYTCNSKRDDNLKAVKRRQKARAAIPQASHPEMVTIEQALAKKRRMSALE